jgi:hypothetical protein
LLQYCRDKQRGEGNTVRQKKGGEKEKRGENKKEKGREEKERQEGK